LYVLVVGDEAAWVRRRVSSTRFFLGCCVAYNVACYNAMQPPSDASPRLAYIFGISPGFDMVGYGGIWWDMVWDMMGYSRI